MNPFQLSYPELLREFSQLRSSLKNKELNEICIKVDHWWQQAPLIKHNLAWSDSENWPDPWTLLSDNLYGPLDRGIGMCYTLLLMGVENIELVQAIDEYAEEHYLVLVDKPKYTLNYWPNSVISTSLNQFKVLNSKSLEFLKNKIK